MGHTHGDNDIHTAWEAVLAALEEFEMNRPVAQLRKMATSRTMERETVCYHSDGC